MNAAKLSICLIGKKKKKTTTNKKKNGQII